MVCRSPSAPPEVTASLLLNTLRLARACSQPVAGPVQTRPKSVAASYRIRLNKSEDASQFGQVRGVAQDFAFDTGHQIIKVAVGAVQPGG
jgi:hypothetical protein